MAVLVARKVYLRQLQVPRIGEFDWIEILVLKKKIFSNFRHSQYSSYASPWPATWSASSSSRSTGCSLRRAPTSGCSTFGTRVSSVLCQPEIRSSDVLQASYQSKSPYLFIIRHSPPDVKCPNYVHYSIIRKLFSPLEKGICLPTVFLWLLFVYIEAAIRLKEYKFHFDTKNLPFHLDLCRPFAAHWWV